MNCAQCNAPLEPGARFCRNCGYAVPASSSRPPQNNNNNGPTKPAPVESPFPQLQQSSQSPQAQYTGQPLWPEVQPIPETPRYNQQSMPMQSPPQGAANPASPPSTDAPPASAPRRRGKKWPWPVKVLITLAALVVLLVGGWFLVARPILHNMAVDQFNQLLSSKLDLVVPIPVITTVPITEDTLNTLMSLDPPPAPLQNAVVHIAPPVLASDGSYTGGVQFSFQVYGLSNSISMIPTASNGQIVITNVKVDGLMSWILSADDMTSLLNAQLQDAVTRLHRQITGITLKGQEMDIQLGSFVF